jgi:hypothetical protein
MPPVSAMRSFMISAFTGVAHLSGRLQARAVPESNVTGAQSAEGGDDD